MTNDFDFEKVFANDPEMLALLLGAPKDPQAAEIYGSLAVKPDKTQTPDPDLFPSGSLPCPTVLSAEEFLLSLAEETPGQSSFQTPPPDTPETGELFDSLFPAYEEQNQLARRMDSGFHKPNSPQSAEERPAEISPEAAGIPEIRAKKNGKIARIICNLLFYIFCFFILAGAAGMALSGDTQKSYFGYRFYNVRTPSMTPQEGGPSGGFYAGDLIIVKLCTAREIEVGDIITFVPGQAATATLTHRVVEIKDEVGGTPGIYFVTRGDANNADDPPIRGDGDTPMLIGKKVFSIRALGSVIKFVQENTVLSLIFLLSVFGFMIALRHYFTVAAKTRRRRENRNDLPPSA